MEADSGVRRQRGWLHYPPMSDASSNPAPPTVAVFDAFAGEDSCVNELHAVLSALGVNTKVTADPVEAIAAQGLVVAASGDSSAALRAFTRSHAPRVVGQRLAGSRPVLAVGAGMDALFERGVGGEAGFGEWPGGVDKLSAPLERAVVVAAEGSQLIAEGAEYVFGAATGVSDFELAQDEFIAYPKLSWVEGMPVLAAVENGPLSAVRFHPERSGEAGAEVLRRWIDQLG